MGRWRPASTAPSMRNISRLLPFFFSLFPADDIALMVITVGIFSASARIRNSPAARKMPKGINKASIRHLLYSMGFVSLTTLAAEKKMAAAVMLSSIFPTSVVISV